MGHSEETLRDGNGREIQFVCNDEIFSRLSKIRSCDTLKSILSVFYRPGISLSDLAEFTHTNVANLERTLDKADWLNLIEKCSDSSGAIVYLPHKSLFYSLPCENCDKAKCKNQIYSCKASYDCKFNYYRFVRGFILLSYREGGFKRVGFQDWGKRDRITEKKISEKLVEAWELKDFSAYLHKLCKQYSHLIPYKVHSVRRTVLELKKIFVIEFKSRWKCFLKYYIKYAFAKASEANYVPSLKKMVEMDSIQRFLDSCTIKSCLRCKKKLLWCPYWKCGSCSLDAKLCDESFEKKIIGLYN